MLIVAHIYDIEHRMKAKNAVNDKSINLLFEKVRCPCNRYAFLQKRNLRNFKTKIQQANLTSAHKEKRWLKCTLDRPNIIIHT